MDFYKKLPQVPLIQNNRDYLVKYCTGKRVLHLGCVDAGVLEEKFQQGDLLHQRLAAVTQDLWGFDIDKRGIEFLRSKGFSQLYQGDVTQVSALRELQQFSFDVILAGEIVEHLLNPGLFFDAIKTLMQPNHTELIVTVPNAYGTDGLVAMLRRNECVHPDHNYWFSYSTITTLIQKCGYQIKAVNPYSNQFFPFLSRPKQSGLLRYFASLGKRTLVRTLYRMTPFWGDGITVIATTGNNEE
ncbi:MAG TPA: methyltransferase domain-containing protein [Phototrophicaceae bacterium]|nr:methyltransferase domain-containing protein [Phototrophicaceae bacterium]